MTSALRQLLDDPHQPGHPHATGLGERGQDDGPGADGAGAGDTGDRAGPPAREMGRREKGSLRSEEISR